MTHLGGCVFPLNAAVYGLCSSFHQVVFQSEKMLCQKEIGVMAEREVNVGKAKAASLEAPKDVPPQRFLET